MKKPKLTLLLVSLTLLLTSCSAEMIEVADPATEAIVEDLIEPLTEKSEYYRSLDDFQKINCKPEIDRGPGYIGGASMYVPISGNMSNYPDDLVKYGKKLNFGNDIENALIVSLAYLAELEDLYTYVHGLYRAELRASRGTYDIFLNKALNASQTLCNLEPEGFEFLGYATDELGNRVRYPDLDSNCRNLDPKVLIKTIKIADDIDYSCIRNNELSRSQQLKVQPILQNLLDNWDSMVMFMRATNYQIEKIGSENEVSIKEDLPNCVEYPTDNPKYKIVKCTNLP